MPIDLVTADAAAVSATVGLVAQASDHTLRTPCAGWNLDALIAHMTEQHLVFAAAVRGEAVPAVRTYAEAADLVLAAFAEPGVLDRPIVLPEFHPTMTFPGRQVLGFHLVDYVVHGWDVAAALGVAYSVPSEILAVTLPIARAVPGGEARLAPNAAFGPQLEVPAGASPLDEILLLLGRSPLWNQRRDAERVPSPVE
jgi:uncharacterized protein (TIGR03086 family)